MDLLGERLKKFRTSRNMIQSEVADIVGVTKETISAYEKGSRSPSTEVLQKLADLFETSMDFLAGRTDMPHVFDDDERGFISDSQDGVLSLEEIMAKYPLTIGDRPATKEEVEEAIKFIKARRIMDML